MTSPSQPGALYTLDLESLRCMSEDPPIGWRTDFQPGFQHDDDSPPFRVACSPDPVRSGLRSARFDLRWTDPDAPGSGSKRAEIKSNSLEPDNAERWYGFSIYLDDWKLDTEPEILTQWHQDDSEDLRFGGSPPLSLGICNDQWQVSIRKEWDDVKNKDTADQPVAGWDSNRWTDWVFHVVWTTGDGRVTAWKDGSDTPTFEYAGQTKFPDGSGHQMKFGIYKWPWNNGETKVGQRIIYFDELRISGSGGREAVAPTDAEEQPRGCLSALTRPFRTRSAQQRR